MWQNNTYVISKGYNQINLWLLYDEVMFFNHIKISKGSECLFLFKRGWSQLIKKFSIKVTLKSLLLLASMEISSKPDEWFQNKWCSFIVIHRTVIPLHSFSSKSRNSKVFTHSDFKMAISFTIRGTAAATTLKLINNARTKESSSFIFEGDCR